MAKLFDEIMKANPYHDERGRFTSAPGGVGSGGRILSYSTGAGSDEVYMRADMMVGEKVAGYLEYSVYEDTPHIQYIHTSEDFKRQGVATKLMQDLQQQYPDTEIDFGMTTPDGTKFIESITYEVKNEKIAEQKKVLNDNKAELDRTQAALDNLYEKLDTGTLTDQEDEQLTTLGDRWQELYDGIHVMEQELAGKKESKRLVRLDAEDTRKSMSFDQIIEKFNPYHDAKGRFATSGSYTSFTYAPGKSKAHFLSIERLKELTAARMPSEAQAKTLKGIETRTRNLKKEQYRVVDREGNVVLQKQGDEGSVSYTMGEAREHIPGNITIHNHPDGGTFSPPDLSDIGHGATEIRAASPEGTYVLRNARYGGKYDPAKEKTWYDMQQDLEAASGQFKTHREMKKEIRKPFDEQLKPMVDKWEKRRAEGASQEELTTLAKEYTAACDAMRPQIEAATRKAFVDQYHHWYNANAGKYGLEYEFIPVKTRARKGVMMDDLMEIEKSDGDIVLDRKLHDDVAEVADAILAEIKADFPAVQKSAESFSIFKTDQDKRLVFGWASVAITADGQQIEDVQKDMIDPEDLEEAAYSYVLNFRDTGEEHIPTLRKKGKLVESCVFTKEKQAAIGIPEGIVPEAWWVGFYIEDDEAWEKIKNGTYTMFSIEGKAKRVPVEKSDRFDQIMEVEKFNPYHDERGRFASATGYTSFTFRTKDPKHQKWADMAMAREKERAGAAAAVANPTNDPDTIAGAKRGQPMTHQQADEGRANPEYARRDAADKKMQDANKKLVDAIHRDAPQEEREQLQKELEDSINEYNKTVADTRQYRVNCQSCVVAYEARLRGYDVEAVGKTGKNQIQNKLAEKAETAWIDPATGKMPEPLRNDPSIRTSKQAQKWLEQNVEEGARYEFAHGWKGTNGYHGHIVTVQKEGGSVRIFDPQNGKTYTGDEFTGYMNRVKPTYSTKHYDGGLYGRTKSVPHGRLELLRVDNLQINENVANAVLKGAN